MKNGMKLIFTNVHCETVCILKVSADPLSYLVNVLGHPSLHDELHLYTSIVLWTTKQEGLTAHHPSLAPRTAPRQNTHLRSTAHAQYHVIGKRDD